MEQKIEKKILEIINFNTICLPIMANYWMEYTSFIDNSKLLKSSVHKTLRQKYVYNYKINNCFIVFNTNVDE